MNAKLPQIWVAMVWCKDPRGTCGLVSCIFQLLGDTPGSSYVPLIGLACMRMSSPLLWTCHPSTLESAQPPSLGHSNSGDSASKVPHFEHRVNKLLPPHMVLCCVRLDHCTKGTNLHSLQIGTMNSSIRELVHSIEVISSAFEGQSSVNRQRMVYKAIWEELQNTVHAVDQMTTRTPAEAAQEVSK
eukprot:Gb_03732 [translate_table: standard]